MYAQISNTGIVLMLEDCYREGNQYPLKELYHKDIFAVVYRSARRNLSACRLEV